jgi:Domain of unknown function (DUF4082)
MLKFAKPLAAAAAIMVATGAQAAVLFEPSAIAVTDYEAGNLVSLGNVFTAAQNAQATALGFYTPTNLVGGGETVALYNSAGTLLASVFVEVPVNTPGQYFFQSIAPILLTAGQQYTVVNFVGQNAWAYGSVSASGASFNYNSFSYGPTLAYTAATGGSGPAYIGPNIAITAVPETATWGMMIAGFGIVGGAMRRRTARTAIA